MQIILYFILYTSFEYVAYHAYYSYLTCYAPSEIPGRRMNTMSWRWSAAISSVQMAMRKWASDLDVRYAQRPEPGGWNKAMVLKANVYLDGL